MSATLGNFRFWITSIQWLLFWGCLYGTGGCSSGLPRAVVHGEVTVDDLPVERGTISFVPLDGVGDPISGPIENGRYKLLTTAGPKLVQISQPVVVDKRKEHPGADASWIEITTERLPPEYHSNSQLRCELRPGDNLQNWKITLKADKSKR